VPARMCGYRSNRCSCRSGAAKAPSPHQTKGRWKIFKIKTHEFHAGDTPTEVCLGTL
jgi:hypothetical protein